MSKLDMFLDSDQDKAKGQLDVYDYFLMNAIQHMAKGEFEKAAAYHENISITLNELQTMKDSKQNVNLVIKQIEGERQQIDLLKKLKGVSK